MRKLYLALVLAVCAGVAPHAVFGDTIVASSQLGSTTTFDVLLSGAPVTFNAGSILSVTGLTGVTGANLVGYAASYGTLTQTATSVSYQLAYAMTFGGGAPSDFALFAVSTRSPFAGLATFSLQESSGTVNGTVAAPTPEPAGVVLLGTGMAALMWLTWRQRSGNSPEVTALA